jgi:hypothetical protein
MTHDNQVRPVQDKKSGINVGVEVRSTVGEVYFAGGWLECLKQLCLANSGEPWLTLNLLFFRRRGGQRVPSSRSARGLAQVSCTITPSLDRGHA